MKRVISASKDYDEIHIFGDSSLTSKLTFEVKGDNAAFFEGHWWKKWDKSDASIYLSSHSGCPVGCKMCGTNRYHVRPASVNEIVAQFEYMHRKMFPCINEESEYGELVCKFLYMGEPLLNIANVDAALRHIATKYKNWTILVSTTGPNIDYTIIKNWIRDFGSRILISFSIHKLDDSDRDVLIPFKDKLSVAQIKEVGTELYRANPDNKISFSYNLFNREAGQKLADRMHEEFPSNVWLPCVQYLYDKTGKEDPEYELQCNVLIDDFIDKLKVAGYDECYGFYAPVSWGDSHLVTGCGQFVEFQRYAKLMNLERII